MPMSVTDDIIIQKELISIMELSDRFTKELLERCRRAESLYNCRCARIIRDIESRGGVQTLRGPFSRGRPSDIFDPLCAAGHPELTPEALAVEGRYASLFTDDEVNLCFSLLCDQGHFKI